MLFNSSVFLFAFLPTTFLVYFLLVGLGARTRSIFCLVAASVFFYGWWSPILVPLLVCSVLGNFIVGIVIQRATIGQSRSVMFVAGVGGNLLLLGFFKYAGFFTQTINALTDVGIPVPEITLPLAISFFTFQQIAYLADVHAGQKAEKNIIVYALFVTFFPQLIAGPIVHHREMIPQYAQSQPTVMDVRLVSLGLTVFVVGLFKKMVLADTAAKLATTTFDVASRGDPLAFNEAWAGAIAYSFQIYFDFSGYSDMAIGLGLMFGIRFPLNFLSPYKATSIVDFWRRWHMTLSRFLRDYLYIPLGGGRKGRPRRYLNLLVVMLLGGLWHGAGWTFVIWGGLHGFYLVINHFWQWLRPQRQGSSVTGVWAGRTLTFLVVTLAWVFFRADDLQSAMAMLRSMSGADGFTLPLSLRQIFGDAAGTLETVGVSFVGVFPNGIYREPLWAILTLAGMLGWVWLLPNSTQLLRSGDPDWNWADFGRETEYQLDLSKLLRWKPTVTWGVFTGVALAVCITNLNQVSEFIYFNF